MGFVDGSLKALPKFVPSSTAEGADLVPNPAYDRWVDQDQHILSGLLSSMTKDVLPDVVSASTAQDAWCILTGMFSSATRARIVQIQIELFTTKKRCLSTADYFRKIKGFASELAAADAPLHDEEVIAYLLAGLGPDYDSFVTSMTTKKEALMLDNVYNYFMSYEARQLQHQAVAHLHVGTSANFVGRGGGRGGAPRGRGGAGRGAPNSGGFGHGNTGYPTGRGHGGAPSNHDNNNKRPQCQICGKVGHIAVKCWYRHDDSYQEDTPLAAVVTTSYQVDPNWYNDTGATDHITNDLDHLAVREQYHGNDIVQGSNRAGLRIMHLGSCSINTDTRPLALTNILHVPEISKNLLSVHKLARDNNIFFEFHP
jgi:hypothetical protein